MVLSDQWNLYPTLLNNVQGNLRANGHKILDSRGILWGKNNKKKNLQSNENQGIPKYQITKWIQNLNPNIWLKLPGISKNSSKIHLKKKHEKLKISRNS